LNKITVVIEKTKGKAGILKEEIKRYAITKGRGYYGKLRNKRRGGFGAPAWTMKKKNQPKGPGGAPPKWLIKKLRCKELQQNLMDSTARAKLLEKKIEKACATMKGLPPKIAAKINKLKKTLKKVEKSAIMMTTYVSPKKVKAISKAKKITKKVVKKIEKKIEKLYKKLETVSEKRKKDIIKIIKKLKLKEKIIKINLKTFIKEERMGRYGSMKYGRRTYNKKSILGRLYKTPHKLHITGFKKFKHMKIKGLIKPKHALVHKIKSKKVEQKKLKGKLAKTFKTIAKLEKLCEEEVFKGIKSKKITGKKMKIGGKVVIKKKNCLKLKAKLQKTIQSLIALKKSYKKKCIKKGVPMSGSALKKYSKIKKAIKRAEKQIKRLDKTITKPKQHKKHVHYKFKAYKIKSLGHIPKPSSLKAIKKLIKIEKKQAKKAKKLDLKIQKILIKIKLIKKALAITKGVSRSELKKKISKLIAKEKAIKKAVKKIKKNIKKIKGVIKHTPVSKIKNCQKLRKSLLHAIKVVQKLTHKVKTECKEVDAALKLK